jgi:hypothetical protein
MAVKRDREWLIATRSDHVAYEMAGGVFRLSFAPDRLVTGTQAVAGLAMAEMVAEWDHLLWEVDRNVVMVWALLRTHANTLGMDVLDAVIRCQQEQWPTTAAEWAVWTR